jgi:hypothetical protein
MIRYSIVRRYVCSENASLINLETESKLTNKVVHPHDLCLPGKVKDKNSHFLWLIPKGGAFILSLIWDDSKEEEEDFLNPSYLRFSS